MWENLHSALPGAARKQDQNREDLQSSGEHICRQYQLAQIAQMSKIAGGTHRFHTGTDVIEAGKHGGKRGTDGLIIQRNDQVAENDNEHIGGKIGVGVVQNLFVDHISVVANGSDPTGVEDLGDISAQTF